MADLVPLTDPEALRLRLGVPPFKGDLAARAAAIVADASAEARSLAGKADKWPGGAGEAGPAVKSVVTTMAVRLWENPGAADRQQKGPFSLDWGDELGANALGILRADPTAVNRGKRLGVITVEGYSAPAYNLVPVTYADGSTGEPVPHLPPQL